MEPCVFWVHGAFLRFSSSYFNRLEIESFAHFFSLLPHKGCDFRCAAQPGLEIWASAERNFSEVFPSLSSDLLSPPSRWGCAGDRGSWGCRATLTPGNALILGYFVFLLNPWPTDAPEAWAGEGDTCRCGQATILNLDIHKEFPAGDAETPGQALLPPPQHYRHEIPLTPREIPNAKKENKCYHFW